MIFEKSIYFTNQDALKQISLRMIEFNFLSELQMESNKNVAVNVIVEKKM